MYNEEWEGVDETIPDRDRWSIIESLSARMGQHQFMASSPERDRKSEITFEGNEWLSYYPQRNPTLHPSDFYPGKAVRGAHEFTMSPYEAILLEEATGRKTIAQVLKHTGLAKLDQGERAMLAKEFYTRLWRLGHVFHSRVPIKRNTSATG